MSLAAAIAPPQPGILLARGVCRAFAAMGFATVTELTLSNGRRADVVALDGQAGIHIVEVKSSIADFRADRKWAEYRQFCDTLSFAVPENFPHELIPAECGLLVADPYGAEILRAGPPMPLAAARRKAMLMRFGRLAALRLQRLNDPSVPEYGWS